MMDKREQLARALAFRLSVRFAAQAAPDVVQGMSADRLRNLDLRAKADMFELVDAFLAELREPDEKMLDYGEVRQLSRSKVLWVWQAMIDAIE